jgi:hypothetical protein
MHDINHLSLAIRDLYAIVDRLGEEFAEHDRHFTLDGHLLGSIGEVYAAECHGICLYASSKKAHDGWKIDADGKKREIQIKVTQTRAKRKVVPISYRPDYLIVLLVDEDGSFDEVYNGPGIKVWDLVKDKPKPANGQYQVTLSKLRELDAEVREEDRV